MKKVVLLTVAVMLCLLALMQACSDIAVTEPESAPATNVVYFVEHIRGGCFRYTPDTGILDTLPIPFTPTRVTVSHDGALLYLGYGDSTKIYDVASGQLTNLPIARGNHIVVSPDGKHLAIEADSLLIVGTSDYSVLFHDSVMARGGMFGASNSTYYASALWEGRLYTVSLESEPKVETYDQDLWPSATIPLRNGERVFLGRAGGMVSVYNFPTETFAFNRSVAQIDSDCRTRYATTTIDHSRVFFCHPNEPIVYSGCYPPEPIRIYDAVSNRMLPELPLDISSVTDEGDTLTERLEVLSLAVTPDSKWLVATTWGSADIVTIALPAMEIMRIHNHPETVVWGSITTPLVP